MTRIHYAIGDVHGRDDLLAAMHATIVADHQRHGQGHAATIVHVGDYIDGGAMSPAVIDRLMRGVAGFAVVNLKGNHEHMLLACLATDAHAAWSSWLDSDGATMLRALGLPETLDKRNPRALRDALGSERVTWIEELALYHATAEHIFVHAGIRPGVPLGQQHEKDLLWIRDGFLDCDDDFGRLVVHGHTPLDEPLVKHNRIDIDIGSDDTGRLASVVLETGAAPRFLFVEGEPGPGLA